MPPQETRKHSEAGLAQSLCRSKQQIKSPYELRAGIPSGHKFYYSQTEVGRQESLNCCGFEQLLSPWDLLQTGRPLGSCPEPPRAEPVPLQSAAPRNSIHSHTRVTYTSTGFSSHRISRRVIWGQENDASAPRRGTQVTRARPRQALRLEVRDHARSLTRRVGDQRN